MSYCRFTGDSDVYLYLSKQGWECCGCSLSETGFAILRSPAEALSHLEQHEEAGDKVPPRTIIELRTDVEVVRVAARLRPIPVSERLPDGTCLIWLKSGWIPAFYRRHLQRWETLELTTSNCKSFDEVTHWLPMPPKPE